VDVGMLVDWGLGGEGDKLKRVPTSPFIGRLGLATPAPGRSDENAGRGF
jgi:hypothetical protein